MPVLVLDFDSLGREATVAQLKASSALCVFVVWYPWRFNPSEVADLHDELVENGATLVERASITQPLESCWAELKTDLNDRERRWAERSGKPAGQAGFHAATS